MKTKTCRVCSVRQPTSAFHRASKAPDGLDGRCKTCKSIAGRQWREENRDHVMAANARYRATHREERAAYNRQWYADNREHRADYAREWYLRNRAEALASHKQWRDDNRGRMAELQRRWREQNQDQHREYHRLANHKRRANLTDSAVEPFTMRDLRDNWVDQDLYVCFYCGCSLADGFELEHFYPLKPDEETTPTGPHAVWNLVPSCVPCNRGVDGKHSREPWQFLRESLAEQGTDLDAAIAGLEAIAARRRRT